MSGSLDEWDTPHNTHTTRPYAYDTTDTRWTPRDTRHDPQTRQQTHDGETTVDFILFFSCFTSFGVSRLFLATTTASDKRQERHSIESIERNTHSRKGIKNTNLVDPARNLCLSQRFSHACPSTNEHVVHSETANGSLHQL